ncbi:MAG TPA: T9SS type A sorting domain-containing protein, partial [Candidatus Kapabacteria bacterium]
PWQSDTSMFVRSTDNGTSWSNCKGGIDLKQIREIYIFESSGDVVFATFQDANSSFGISSCYISHDKGKTWTKKTDLSSLGVYSLTGRRKHRNDGYLISTFNSPSDIYIVDTGFSIIKPYKFFGTLEAQLRTAYIGDSIIWAFPSYYRDSLVISTDNGDTWEKRPHIFDKAIVNSFWKEGEKFIFRCDDISSISSYEYTKEIYRSSDKGSSWIPIQMPIPEPSAFRIVHSNDTLFVIYTYPDSIRSVCFRSYDGGVVWKEANTPFVYPWKIGDIVNDNNHILIYTDNYQTYSYTSNYGVTWKNIEIPISLYGENIFHYDLVDDTRYIFGVKGSGYNTRPHILTSQQDIDEWSEKTTNLPDYVGPWDIARYKNILFLLSISGLENSNHDGSTRLYKSLDNGSTWVQVGEALPTGHSLYFTDDFIFIAGYYDALYRHPLALAGIHEPKPNSNNSLTISTYPNPTTKELTISHTSGQAERVVMYDMTGTLVKSDVVSSEAMWDVSALPSGSYMLGIPGGKMHVVQVVK